VRLCPEKSELGHTFFLIGVHFREKVRIVGICPTGVNTEMLKGWAESRSPEPTQLAKADMPNDGDPIDPRNIGMLEPEEIGLAFQRLVVGGESGQMLVVMPGFSFYWPDWNRRLVKTLLSNTLNQNPN